MIYRVYVYDKRMKKYEIKSECKNINTAKTKAQKHIDKGRSVKIIPIPTDELDVGLKIYLSNGDLYGEIVDGSDSFWYIRRNTNKNDDIVFFLKDNFLEKYENGTFIIKEECE